MKKLTKRAAPVLFAVALLFLTTYQAFLVPERVEAGSIGIGEALSYDMWAWLFTSCGVVLTPVIENSQTKEMERVYMDRWAAVSDATALPVGYDVAYSEVSKDYPNLLTEIGIELYDTFDVWCEANGFGEYSGLSGAEVVTAGVAAGCLSIPRDLHAVIRQFAADCVDGFSAYHNVPVACDYVDVIDNIVTVKNSYYDNFMKRIYDTADTCFDALVISYEADGTPSKVEYYYNPYSDAFPYDGIFVSNNRIYWSYGSNSYNRAYYSYLLLDPAGVPTYWNSVASYSVYLSDNQSCFLNGDCTINEDIISGLGSSAVAQAPGVLQAAEKLDDYALYTPTKQDFRVIEGTGPDGKPQKEIEGGIIIPGAWPGTDQDAIKITQAAVDAVSNGQILPEEALAQIGVGVVDLPASAEDQLPVYVNEPVHDGGGSGFGDNEDKNVFPWFPGFLPGDGKDDITDLFPFCIPFDLYDVFAGMKTARAEAPHFHYEFNFNTIDYNFVVDVDMADYEQYVKIFRSGMLVLFILGLMFGTHKLTSWMKGL